MLSLQNILTVPLFSRDHIKNKELREIILSRAPGTRLSEVTQKEDTLESVQVKILHGNASIKQMMGENFFLMVRLLVHRVFLR